MLLLFRLWSEEVRRMRFFAVLLPMAYGHVPLLAVVGREVCLKISSKFFCEVQLNAYNEPYFVPVIRYVVAEFGRVFYSQAR